MKRSYVTRFGMISFCARATPFDIEKAILPCILYAGTKKEGLRSDSIAIGWWHYSVSLSFTRRCAKGVEFDGFGKKKP